MPNNSEIPNSNLTDSSKRLPPGQQLVAPGKWPVIGQRNPSDTHAPWQISISGRVANPITLSLDELRAQPQHSITVDIHCVTRWSKLDATFSGVLLSQLLELAVSSPKAKYISFTSRTDNRHSSSLELETALDLGTLIVLGYEGAPLEIGHGGPIRCLVPGRYFYKSVKWVESIELLEQDRLGNWEAESGYHNAADPWLEQRYMAPTIDKRKAAKLIESKDFSGQELRSIDCSKMNLKGLKASEGSLRDSKFVDAALEKANFQAANLSNSHFCRATLVDANFRDADVEGADFSGADLRGADFTGASLVGASFFSSNSASDNETIKAIIDETTVIPAEARASLFPAQLAFVEQFISKEE